MAPSGGVSLAEQAIIAVTRPSSTGADATYVSSPSQVWEIVTPKSFKIATSSILLTPMQIQAGGGELLWDTSIHFTLSLFSARSCASSQIEMVASSKLTSIKSFPFTTVLE